MNGDIAQLVERTDRTRGFIVYKALLDKGFRHRWYHV